MFFMAVSRWPLSSSEQVGKVSVELLKKPQQDYYKRVGPYVIPTAEGVKSYMLYDVEEGREGEAYKYLGDTFMSFRVVEGYSFVIEPVLTVEEALAMVGLKL